MSDIKSVLFVGVGGQGTILASKILTIGLIGHGYDVKMSEVHGMSQRGGSVSTQVRFGSQVYSPIIGEESADVLVSFEEMEAARYARFLKKDGRWSSIRRRFHRCLSCPGSASIPGESLKN